MSDTQRPEILAMVGATVAVQTVQALASKGILTEDEMLYIYHRAIGSFADPDERVEAVAALQALIPALRVTVEE